MPLSEQKSGSKWSLYRTYFLNEILLIKQFKRECSKLLHLTVYQGCLGSRKKSGRISGRVFKIFLGSGFGSKKSPGFGSRVGFRVGSVKNLNMKPNFSERLGILVICGLNKIIYKWYNKRQGLNGFGWIKSNIRGFGD